MYYRGAAAAVVVFDITNNESYISAKRWVENLKEADTVGKVGPGIIIALVGNKVDLAAAETATATAETATAETATAETATAMATAETATAETATAMATAETATVTAIVTAIATVPRRNVSKEAATAYAIKNNIIYLETSAKDSTNVNNIFSEIVKRIPTIRQPESNPSTIDIGRNSSTKQYCCR
jgi:GTPase SAR1 family protein